MAHPQQIREGLAANLASGDLDIQISAYALTNPTPPCAYVVSGPVNYDESMGRGHDTWTYTVVVLVGFVHDIGAQIALDEMLASHGTRSIKTLVESDRRLAGAVYSVSVVAASGARPYVLEGQEGPSLGAEWTVEVVADGRE